MARARKPAAGPVSRSAFSHSHALEALLENSPAGTWAVDGGYRLLFGNRAFRQECLAGLGREIAPGESVLFEGLSTADHEEWKRYYDRALAGEMFRFERRRKYGPEPSWNEYHFSPITDESGGVTGVIVIAIDVTGRKLAGQALQEQNANLLAVLENTEDLIASRDREHRLVFFNSAFACNLQRLFGVEARGGLNTLEYLPDEQRPFWEGVLARALAGERVQQEFAWDYGEGDLRTYEIAFNPVYLEEEVVGTSEFTRDITAHKAAMQTLDASRARLARAEQIAGLGNWEWDLQRNTLTWSEQVYRLFDVGLDFELTYEGIAALLHRDDRAGNQEFVDRLLAGAGSAELDFRLLRPDGTVRHIHQSAQVWHDDAGKPARVFGIMQDVSETVLARTQLEAASELLQKTFASLDEAVFVIEAEDRSVLACNPAAEAAFGYAPGELLGCTTEFMYPDHSTYEAYPERIRPALDERGAYRAEMPLRRKDGSTFIAEVTDTAVLDERGRRTRVVSVIRDVTDRKAAEEALRRSEEELRLLAARSAQVEEDERRRLARELHDQIGQSLSALSINLNVLRGSAPASDGAFLKRLDDSLALVEGTTERVRDVMAQLRPSVLDDFGLLPALQAAAEQFTGRTGVPVRLYSRPREGEFPRLSGDLETALYRITQEVLANIARHAGASHVNLTLQGIKKRVRLVIQDDGRGFDPDRLRVVAQREGWGLRIMRERAQAVGARLLVDSSHGGGTTVTVEVEV